MLRTLVVPFVAGVCIVLLGLALAAVAYEQANSGSDVDRATSQQDATPTQTVVRQTLVSSVSPPPTSTTEPAPTATAQPAATPEPTAVPQPVAPARPTGLTAFYDPEAGVVLSWQPVAGAGYYNVYRSELPGGGPGAIYTPLGSIAAASVRDNTAQPGHRYYYVVTAVSAGLESVQGNEASVEVP